MYVFDRLQGICKSSSVTPVAVAQQFIAFATVDSHNSKASAESNNSNREVRLH